MNLLETGPVLKLESRWMNYCHTDDDMRDAVYDEMLVQYPELKELSAEENTQLALIALYAVTGDKILGKLLQHEHRTLAFVALTEVYVSVVEQLDDDHRVIELGALLIPTLWYYLGYLLNRQAPLESIEPLTVDVVDDQGWGLDWLAQYQPFAPDTCLH